MGRDEPPTAGSGEMPYYEAPRARLGPGPAGDDPAGWAAMRREGREAETRLRLVGLVRYVAASWFLALPAPLLALMLWVWAGRQFPRRMAGKLDFVSYDSDAAFMMVAFPCMALLLGASGVLLRGCRRWALAVDAFAGLGLATLFAVAAFRSGGLPWEGFATLAGIVAAYWGSWLAVRPSKTRFALRREYREAVRRGPGLRPRPARWARLLAGVLVVLGLAPWLLAAFELRESLRAWDF